jgi:hypothetical protein
VTPRRPAADRRQGDGGKCLRRTWEGEEGTKRSGGTEVALPFCTGAAEVGDRLVGCTAWKEERRVGYGEGGHTERGAGPDGRHRPKAKGGGQRVMGA